MMNDDFYELTIDNSVVEDRLRIASPAALICLKAKAYLNLLADRENGMQVNSKNIKKHRADVLKLIATASFTEPIQVSESMLGCIHQYTDNIFQMLPSQALEDALERSSDDIAVFVEALRDAFIAKQ